MVSRIQFAMLAAAVAFGLIALPSARAAHGGPRLDATHRRVFAAEGVRFTYPSSWHAYEFDWASSFTASIAYVSNVRLQRPCVGQPLSPTCQGPISRLPRNSALLIWTDNGRPGWTFARAQGKTLAIHGRRARLRYLAPQRAWCPRNSRTMLDAAIERPEAPDNWYDLKACISGPRIKAVQRQVMTILVSFRAARR